MNYLFYCCTDCNLFYPGTGSQLAVSICRTTHGVLRTPNSEFVFPRHSRRLSSEQTNLEAVREARIATKLETAKK